MSFKKSLDDNLEIITVVILIAGLGYLLFWLVGCNAVNAGKAFNWLAPSDKEPEVTITISEQDDEVVKR